MKDLEENRINDLYAVIAKMTLAARPKPAASKPERAGEILLLIFFGAALSSIAVLLVALALHHSINEGILLRTIGIVGQVISWSVVLAMFGLLLASVPFFVKLRKDPFFALLDVTRGDMQLYAEYVAELHRYPKPLLQYARMHFSFHREGFDGRLALLSGEIKRIGLFPGLLAVAVGGVKLIHGSNPWLWLPVILTGCFYFMSFAASDKPMKMELVVRIMDYAIEHYPEGADDNVSEASVTSPALAPSTSAAPTLMVVNASATQ
jgi:hypothetical protein